VERRSTFEARTAVVLVNRFRYRLYLSSTRRTPLGRVNIRVSRIDLGTDQRHKHVNDRVAL